MCRAIVRRLWKDQYSAEDGHATDYHLVNLGGSFALRGASLTIIEATGIQAEGRVSPADLGLWKDSQIALIKRIIHFVHSQGQKIGIQLGHAGRKASTVAPWLVPTQGATRATIFATEDVGGWPGAVKGPSAITWGAGHSMPSQLSLGEIKEVIESFGRAANRALEAGIDVIEIHAAHGYLLHSFLSPHSNRRTDAYGGNQTNRERMIFDIISTIRGIIPEGMPLLLRVSCEEWVEHTSCETFGLASSTTLA
jgi:2,4-dienoyl-CoA reductase-like NADH-dependent reductase (Old Yellow Enzyme family)